VAILYVISHVHFASCVIRLPKWLEYSISSGYVWCIIICTEDGGLDILITLVLFHTHIHSIGSPIFNLPIMSCA
jgi:hypothetical protein